MIPSDVLKPEYISQFEEKISFFHHKILNLNTTVFVCKKLIDSDLDRFPTQSDNLLVNLLFRNSFEIMIIWCYKLTEDKGKDAFTLHSFRNEILENCIGNHRYEILTSYKRLKVAKKSISDIIQRLMTIRTEVIAHEIRWNRKDISLNFSELERVVKYITESFQLLSCGYLHLTNWYDFLNGGQTVGTSEVDQLIELLIKNSWRFREAEANKDNMHWKSVKRRFDAEGLEEINKVRARYGYGEI